MNSSISVLTIDDNDSMRLSISSYLEDLGYIVYEANSGDVGLEVIISKKPDVILTDTHMPGTTGIDVLNFVREKLPNIPIIVISGAGDIKFVVEALRAGAWDYITKPIEDLSFLSYTIDQVLKRANIIQENIDKTLEIEKKNIELRETLDKLKNTQDRLIESEKMASLGYMIKGVSHEINTPLGVCLTSMSFVEEQTKEIINLNEKRKMKLSNFTSFTKDLTELTAIVNRSLFTINDLIKNFKLLSVKTDGNIKNRFLLNDTIDSVILLVKSTYPNINVKHEITGENILLTNYPEIINMIISKLTENSIKHGFYNREECKILVHTYQDEGIVYIDFQNNGHHIPLDIIDHVFDPFVTEKKHSGSGLGLCIVYNLAVFTLMGNVSCENKEDGVHFIISFPV